MERTDLPRREAERRRRAARRQERDEEERRARGPRRLRDSELTRSINAAVQDDLER